MTLTVSVWENRKAKVATKNKGLVCVHTTEYALMLWGSQVCNQC